VTRFVAALLIATGPVVVAAVDERTPGAGLGSARSAALLARAHYRGRAQREAEGVEAVRRAGRQAWQVHQQQGDAL
jgi:hypothetical protein